METRSEPFEFSRLPRDVQEYLLSQNIINPADILTLTRVNPRLSNLISRAYLHELCSRPVSRTEIFGYLQHNKPTDIGVISIFGLPLGDIYTIQSHGYNVKLSGDANLRWNTSVYIEEVQIPIRMTLAELVDSAIEGRLDLVNLAKIIQKRFGCSIRNSSYIQDYVLGELTRREADYNNRHNLSAAEARNEIAKFWIYLIINALIMGYTGLQIPFVLESRKLNINSNQLAKIIDNMIPDLLIYVKSWLNSYFINLTT